MPNTDFTVGLQVDAYGASATFTPSAAAYTGGNVVDVAKQFANIGPVGGGQVIITSAVLEIDASALISGETSYSLELFSVTPPSAQADNTAFALPSGDRAAHIDTLNLGTAVAKGGTLKVGTDGINKQVSVPTGGSLWGRLVTNGSFTATAVARIVAIHSVAV